MKVKQQRTPKLFRMCSASQRFLFFFFFFFYSKTAVQGASRHRRASNAIPLHLGSWPLAEREAPWAAGVTKTSTESSSVSSQALPLPGAEGLTPGLKSVIPKPGFGKPKDVSNGLQENLKVSKCFIVICNFFKIKYPARVT